MAEERHLSNAPIEEAVVEIRVTPREGRKAEDLDVLCTRLASTYPTKMLNQQFVAEVRLGASRSAKAEQVNHWLQGYRIESAPKGKVVQFNADLYSFSWLRPYKTWEDFVAEAQTNWRLYDEVWSPTSITRVGTRFVNRIVLPSKGLDFDHYFTAFPRIPPNLPQTLVTFLSRVVVPADEGRTMIAISLALEDTPSEDSISVLLDIDVAREAPHIGTPDTIWLLLDSFRALKNKAFFGSLQEKAISLFT